MTIAGEEGWRPQLVALDIDGTLVDHAGVLPVQVHQAVRRVVAAGVPVVLSTGRSWHSTQPVFDALDLPPGYAVSSNGAVLVQYPPLSIVQQVTFDPAEVLAKVTALAPEALIAVERVGHGYRVSGEFPPGELDGAIELVAPETLSAQQVTRVIIRDPSRSDAEFMDLANRLGLHSMSYFIGYSAWLDIAPRGVDKSTALAQVCQHLGVPRAAVLAIGDGRNDIEMLQWAGRGVALGDAPVEVQRAADAVTGLFAEGGTVAELRRYF